MFKNDATSNIDLEDMAGRLKLNLVGVYSKDELPDKIQVGSYIINLQDSTEGNGTHWTLIMVFDRKNALYFDAFGQIFPKEVGTFLKNYKPIPYSNRIIQDVDSNRCGLYCIACMHYMSRIRRKEMLEQYDDFLNMFRGNPKQNDKILVDYLKRIL
jgi:hypothetical protein